MTNQLFNQISLPQIIKRNNVIPLRWFLWTWEWLRLLETVSYMLLHSLSKYNCKSTLSSYFMTCIADYYFLLQNKVWQLTNSTLCMCQEGTFNKVQMCSRKFIQLSWIIWCRMSPRGSWLVFELLYCWGNESHVPHKASHACSQ